MTMVKFKTSGLKKFGNGDRREVIAGEEVDLPEEYVARYGDGLERVSNPQAKTTGKDTGGSTEPTNHLGKQKAKVPAAKQKAPATRKTPRKG